MSRSRWRTTYLILYYNCNLQCLSKVIWCILRVGYSWVVDWDLQQIEFVLWDYVVSCEFTSWYLVTGTKSDLDRKVRRPYLPSILMFPDLIHDMTVSLYHFMMSRYYPSNSWYPSFLLLVSLVLPIQSSIMRSENLSVLYSFLSPGDSLSHHNFSILIYHAVLCFNYRLHLSNLLFVIPDILS